MDFHPGPAGVTSSSHVGSRQVTPSGGEFRRAGQVCQANVPPEWRGGAGRGGSRHHDPLDQRLERLANPRQCGLDLVFADRADAQAEPAGLPFDAKRLEWDHCELRRFQQVTPDVLVGAQACLVPLFCRTNYTREAKEMRETR